jgi:demethylmenaquinone methyltransferase / 2-methoxy-6-polyprenyl-1,4-benzoquinol methylase
MARSDTSVQRPVTGSDTSEEARYGFVRRMFDRAAPDYDRTEQLFAMGTGSWYRRQALMRAGLRPGMRVVDVGVGTGLVAREAAWLVGDPALVTGVDPSIGMLACARVPPGVRLLGGRAEALPLADGRFDLLSMGYALRHIGDLGLGFREFERVLRPGGRLCLLEITKPEGRFPRALLKGYMRRVMPAVARLVAGSAATREMWRYYWDTTEAAAPPAQVIGTLQAAGFTAVRRHIQWPALSIFAEYQAVKPGAGSDPGRGAV